MDFLFINWQSNMMRVNMAQNLIELLNYERKSAFKYLITGDEA
jgi:hypothetical protein